MYYIRLFERRITDAFRKLFYKDYKKQDRVAAAIAARYNMSKAYKMARDFGLTPIEALEDNDLLTEETYKELVN